MTHPAFAPITVPSPRRFVPWENGRRLLRERDGVPGLMIRYEQPCLTCWEFDGTNNVCGPGCRECGGHGFRRLAEFYSLEELGVEF